MRVCFTLDYLELVKFRGVQVHLFEHAEWHGTPDAVFPNNWFTTHAAGELERRVKEPCLVQYPLKVNAQGTLHQ